MFDSEIRYIISSGQRKKPICQNIVLLQQWLLEQGRCVVCGSFLTKGEKKPFGTGLKIICSCNQVYFYLPLANLYKRLSQNLYKL